MRSSIGEPISLSLSLDGCPPYIVGARASHRPGGLVTDHRYMHARKTTHRLRTALCVLLRSPNPGFRDLLACGKRSPDHIGPPTPLSHPLRVSIGRFYRPPVHPCRGGVRAHRVADTTPAPHSPPMRRPRGLWLSTISSSNCRHVPAGGEQRGR